MKVYLSVEIDVDEQAWHEKYGRSAQMDPAEVHGDVKNYFTGVLLNARGGGAVKSVEVK